jgi:ribosome-interacting GTPase 1
MPANLTQQYLKAEERYRRAASLEEELLCLQEMMKEIPKHKGTDHLQAELKSKISNTKKEMAAEKSGSGKKVRGLRIPRQGAGTVVVLGGPNAGKSQLVASLTRATPEVAPYPFTTVPAPAMMPWEDVAVQLIDTPPITADYMDTHLQNLIRAADLALLMVDLESDSGIEQCQELLDRLGQTKTRLAAKSRLDEEDVGLSYTQTFLLPNKIDAPGASERLELLHELLPLDFAEYVISAQHGMGLETLRTAIYQAMDVVRVY